MPTERSIMLQVSFTREDILKDLDNNIYHFPNLDNGYVYLADVRLSAYRDSARWALVIEVLGATNRDWCDHGGIHNWLYYFGNCIKNGPKPKDADCLCITQDGPEGPTFEEEYHWCVRDEARTIQIRDKVVPINRDPGLFKAKGIALVETPRITAADLLRSLIPEYREILLATEEELRDRLPADLPLILRLNEWYHPEVIAYDAWYNPDVTADQFPSGNSTFQMVADVLVSGNAELYQPADKPNMHWSNWPYGGSG
jgi:hypothetical protein